MKQKFKSLIIGWSCTMMNRNSDFLHWLEGMFPALAELEDGPHLRFYWWIEGLLNRLFVWAFDGSREEEQDALELAYGAELDRYSPRQQAIIEKHYLVYRETDTRRLLPEHASS